MAADPSTNIIIKSNSQGSVFKGARLTPFENTSLTRKFTILYFFMSILPIGFLYFLYLQIRDRGSIVIKEYDFFVILMGMVFLVAVGYFGMKSIFGRLLGLARKERHVIAELLGPDKMSAIDLNNDELVILAESFREITSHLEENVRSLELAKRTLHSVLSKVGQGLSSMDNIDTFLNLILETVTDAMQANTGALLILDEKKNEFYFKAVAGKNTHRFRKINSEQLNDLMAKYRDARVPMILTTEAEASPLDKFFSLPILISPLVLHDNILGIIIVCGRSDPVSFDDEEKNLLMNISLQTAVAIENARLNEDAEKTYFETITALAMAVEAKDTYSRGHSDRVAQFCVMIAKEMGLGQEEILILQDAAKLHDLGKIGITDEVLRKNGPLNAQETEMMKRHPEIGEGIIKPIRSLRPLCDIIRHHHEKLDGSGYPDGLKGDQINLLVRILTVADIFDALTSNRPYRDSYVKGKAFAALYAMKDKLDPKIIGAFEKALA